MPVTQPLNELAKLALIASDDSYFTAALAAPSTLAPLRDTPTYDIPPLFAFSQGFNKVSDDNNSRIDSIGFKFVAYRNETTNEVIVSIGQAILLWDGISGCKVALVCLSFLEIQTLSMRVLKCTLPAKVLVVRLRSTPPTNG